MTLLQYFTRRFLKVLCLSHVVSQSVVILDWRHVNDDIEIGHRIVDVLGCLGLCLGIVSSYTTKLKKKSFILFHYRSL